MKQFMTFAIATVAVWSLFAVAPSTATPAFAGEETTSNMAFAPSGAQAGRVDINSASLTELRTLPGIGQAYSKRIIEHRPYKSVEELSTRKVLPQGLYTKIRDKVVANGR